MENQDLISKREATREDQEFFLSEKIVFLSNEKINKFYDDLKKQLNVLFWVNVAFCAIAAGVVLTGIVLMLLQNSILTGAILSIAGALSELLGNIFIWQYKNSLNKVTDVYFKLLLCNNMTEALNLARKLPLVDMYNKELRYQEMREILRSIMKNFDEHLASNLY